jgi:hypothetical protein
LTEWLYLSLTGGEDQVAAYCVWSIDTFSRVDILGISAAAGVGHLAPVEHLQVTSDHLLLSYGLSCVLFVL